MINAKFTKKNGFLTGFKVKNHSGYAEEGYDIVCAAVSSAVQMAVNTITEILHIDVDVKVDENEPVISLKLKDNSEYNQKISDAIINGLLLQLSLIKEEYPNFIVLKVLEV